MPANSALIYGTLDTPASTAAIESRSCGFTVFYLAHDVHLWDGTIPFSRYAGLIATKQAEWHTGRTHHRPFGKRRF